MEFSPALSHPEDEALSHREAILVHLELENAASTPSPIALRAARLVMTGFQGQQIAAAPLDHLAQCRPTNLTLAVGERRSVCVAFGGFGGMSTEGPLALRLLVAGGDLTLAAPTAPAPRWTAGFPPKTSFAFRSDGWGNSRYSGAGLNLEVLRAYPRVVFGYATLLENVRLKTAGQPPKTFASLGGELRLGFVPTALPLVVMGAAGVRWLSEYVDDSVSASSTALLSAQVGLRYHWALQTLRSSRLLPVRRPPGPLRPLYAEVDYLRLLGREGLPSGQGVVVSLGLALILE